MEVGKIDTYIDGLLELQAVGRTCAEQNVYVVLHRLLTAVSLFDQMTDAERKLVGHTIRKVKKLFISNFSLKERKQRKEKKSFPPHPLIKDKETEKKGEKHTHTAERDFSSLEERRKAFWEKCTDIGNRQKYDSNAVNRFFCRWAQETQETGKMRFEEEKFWNLEARLTEWMSNSYTIADTAAAIRMKRLRKQQEKEQMAEQVRKDEAAEREQADAEREAQAERDRQLAGGLEEQIAANPDGFLAKLQRERQKREDKK